MRRKETTTEPKENRCRVWRNNGAKSLPQRTFQLIYMPFYWIFMVQH